MSVRSAYNYLVSKIGNNRASASDSEGSNYRARRASQGSRPVSLYSSKSIYSLKCTSQPPQAPKASSRSFIRGTLATGLSKVCTLRARDRSRSNVESAKTNPQRQYFSDSPSGSTRRSGSPPHWDEKKPENNIPELRKDSHNSPQLSVVPSEVPPICLSEASDATEPRSLDWQAQPSIEDRIRKKEVGLRLQPSKTYLCVPGVCATWVDSNDVPVYVDRSVLRPEITRLLHDVCNEYEKLKGPFWNRKHAELNEAVTNVLPKGKASGDGTSGRVLVKVREDTQRLPSLSVLKDNWKDLEGDAKNFWDTRVKPVANLCFPSVQSRG
jgi:hypothetical protein